MSADAQLLPLTLSCCRGYNTLDMAYEITKPILIKKSPKREAKFHRKQAEFLGQMEHDFLVYDMHLPTLKILCPTRWTVRAASPSATLKNYGTLMKLWRWPQDNVSDSDMKARIIGVQTEMQTFSFFLWTSACHCSTFPF